MKKILIITAIMSLIFAITHLYARYDGVKKIQQDEYLDFAEEMPAPVDGWEAVYKNIKVPDMAKRMNVKGKVFLMLYVNEEGDIDDIKVIKGIGAGCDEAAVEAFKNVKFNPGKSGGVYVKTKLSIPVIFK
jgi:protein TonB